jgi:NAD(P)H dehydrogenase (quinone)
MHQNAIDAALAAGVRHVAYTSIVDPVEGNPAAPVPEHRETEQALRDSGLAWTMLRNAFYADTEAKACALAMASGRLLSNRGDGRHAFVWREDCAAAAAAVIVGGSMREGKAYDITGPDLLSVPEEAALLSELSGRVVVVETVDDNTYVNYVEHAVPPILPPERAHARATDGHAMREGYFRQLSTAVQALTGRPARSLREMLLTTVSEP